MTDLSPADEHKDLRRSSNHRKRSGRKKINHVLAGSNHADKVETIIFVKFKDCDFLACGKGLEFTE